MSQKLSDTEIQQIRTSFRRCSTETVEAIIKFKESKDPSVVATIVYGIIQRYRPGDVGVIVADLPPTTRLIEDLGIDSLTMLEVVLSIEEALSIRIENEELFNIRTLDNVKVFISQKITGEKSSDDKANASCQSFNREEIMLALPQQSPFLFLDKAVINGDLIQASYPITGDEYFLEGHFKGDPVFPASIVFEAMGQAACLWILSKSEEKLGKPLSARQVLFGSMETAHFYRKARPGETIEMEAKLTKLREPLAVFNCSATINGERLATVEELVIVFGEATALVDQPNSSELREESSADDLPKF